MTRFVFERSAVRGAVVSLDATYRDSLACHPYPAGLQRLLGEELAAICLLSESLKFDGSSEIESILAEHGTVGVSCEFCNRRYEFSREEARVLFEATAPPGRVRH